MKEFLKLLVKVITYSAGFAVFGAVFLLADSIKNKPLTKEEVKEIVKTEVSPIVTEVRTQLNTHITNTSAEESNFKALENSYLRTIKDKTELLRYKDEKIKALDEALKKNNNFQIQYKNLFQDSGQ